MFDANSDTSSESGPKTEAVNFDKNRRTHIKESLKKEREIFTRRQRRESLRDAREARLKERKGGTTTEASPPVAEGAAASLPPPPRSKPIVKWRGK
jgi:hypothetical protein